MVRAIVKDPMFLRQKSLPAGKEDAGTVRDLCDTLLAHRGECVGLAANMIGVLRRIVVIDLGGFPLPLINPTVLSQAGPYPAEEGCLSLSGVRQTTRYETVTVSFLDAGFQPRTQTFTGFAAQILQHELDHCNGILI